MKKFLLAACILLFIAEAKAQYPKLIVQFKDKNTTPHSISTPSQYLSARAIARRTRYSVAVDSTDLPVVPRYIDSVLSKGPVTLLSRSKWLNQILIQCTDQPTIAKIQALPFVKSVQGIGFRMIQPVTRNKFNYEVTPVTTSTHREMADQYNYGSSYNQVHIHEGEFLHNKGYSGQGMHITVLDAGFFNYKTITAFDSVRLEGRILGERDFVAFDNSVNEDNIHGMQCLSTMAANLPNQMVGTSPKASYWLIRTENVASEYPIEEHNWVVGAEFADSTGSDMISSSLGYYDFDDPAFNYSYADLYKNTTTVSKGASLAAKKGLIVMNSAGNEGNSLWKYIGFPADADSVCAVGAVNGNTAAAASFSSYGYPGKIKPNIASVGAPAIVLNGSGAVSSGSGTSFANPNIAGLIACLWQAFPQFNNMKILDAVYRSCPTYATPNDRVGFGIPNMKTAYRLLKHDVNVGLYGNKKLMATPNPFTSQIDVKVIGRVDGNAVIDLLSPNNTVIATKNLTTEIEEVYDFSFLNLSSQPAGTYVVRLTDASSSDTVQTHKVSILPSMNDWLVAYPSPFRNSLQVYLKAPESGKASLRIIDMKGRLVDRVEMNTTQSTIYTINFSNISSLPSGVYTIEYIGNKEKKRVRIVKQ